MEKKDKDFIRDILTAIWIVGFDMEHEISYLEEIPSNIAKMPNPRNQIVIDSHTSRFLKKEWVIQNILAEENY